MFECALKKRKTMTPLHRGRASRVLRGRMLLSRTLVVSIVGETTTSERLSCAFCKVIVLRMCIKKAEDDDSPTSWTSVTSPTRQDAPE